MRYQVEFKKTRYKGNGVFATANFKPGEIIEKCPVITMRPKERKFAEETILDYYIYPWKTLNDAAVVLGYGAVYNHSYEPNAKWIRDYDRNLMIYKAIRPIKKGQEVTINYNGDYGPPEDVDWFGEVK